MFLLVNQKLNINIRHPIKSSFSIMETLLIISCGLHSTPELTRINSSTTLLLFVFVGFSLIQRAAKLPTRQRAWAENKKKYQR